MDKLLSEGTKEGGKPKGTQLPAKTNVTRETRIEK
jgi:hypothetical protein